MRIAVASSGLGHIARGVETWARDTADALHERGVDVTLFSGAPLPARANGAPRVAVSCIRREAALSRIIVRLMPGFSWRWGLKNGYGLEQLTFWLNLRRQLELGQFDILHVQDPMVARWCRRARLAGRMTTKEVLAHGTEEPAAFLSPFDFVQHLLPYHQAQVLNELGWETAPEGWCVAPNFVDTERFVMEKSISQRRRVRRGLGIPEDAFVVGSAGAIKKHHKRMDYLIHEFASFSASSAPLREISPHLVIAGARENETDSVIREAQALLGEKVTFLVDHPFEQMPDFYKALDVFVLPSLFEMMGIVFAEAMASGVPAIGHEHPVMREVIGDGGLCVDMAGEGGLAEVLEIFSRRGAEGAEACRTDRMALFCLARMPAQNSTMAGHEGWGKRARAHVEKVFSKDVVIQKYIEYYERVLRGG